MFIITAITYAIGGIVFEVFVESHLQPWAYSEIKSTTTLVDQEAKNSELSLSEISMRTVQTEE